MNHLKFFLTIAALTLFTSVTPKVYFDNTGKELFDGKNLPVLDMCIFLDPYKVSKKNLEEWTYDAKESYGDPVMTRLYRSIKEKEASISSSNLIRELIDRIKDENEYKKIIDDLNNPNYWLKLITKDKEFVILIPKKKYPDIKNIKQENINNIEKIGLGKTYLEILEQIPYSNDAKFYTESDKAQKNRINTLAIEKPKIKTSGLIEDKTLFNIFSNSPDAKKIMKRVYLAGHGEFQEEIQSKDPQEIKIKKPKSSTETKAAIAQLEPYQYVKFLEDLSKKGCSFLYIHSCYVGGYNALTYQNTGFYEETNIFKKFESITNNIPFIIVVESTPDEAIKNSYFNVNNFFIKINEFFKNQKDSLAAYFATEKKTIPSNASETEIISGKLLNPQLSLIDQKPWLISSKIFRDILDQARDLNSSNADTYLSSARFPGKPFFRASMGIHDPKLGKEYLRLTENALLKKRRDLMLKIECESRTLTKDEIKSIKDEIKTINESEEYKKIIAEQKNLPKVNEPMVINYNFLLSHEIKNKNNPISIGYPSKQALIYPSIINTPIIIENYVDTIVSMIPGRAQHYFNSITVKNEIKDIFDVKNKFYSFGKANKLYFIEKLQDLKDKEISNLIIKIEKEVPDYIYKNKDGKYHNDKGEVIENDEAKKTIKKWILQTTPAKEAIHEATAGIENIYKFRIRISQVGGKTIDEGNGKKTFKPDPFFGTMFSEEELGKKPVIQKIGQQKSNI